MQVLFLLYGLPLKSQAVAGLQNEEVQSGTTVVQQEKKTTKRLSSYIVLIMNQIALKSRTVLIFQRI
jgi:hypothetical protein